MKRFAFFLLGIHLCLVQEVFTQCLPSAAIGCGACGLGSRLSSIGEYGLGNGFAASGLGASLLNSESAYGISPAAAYGGSGMGDLLVLGELPVAGSTLIGGQVPILGTVRFEGAVPAAGSVSIVGRCGCGCNGYAY